MRVIAGRLGGRRLVAPRGLATRPTSDRVREALFSALGDVGGARVLDLFAGTGALGIEALSRGASSVQFVEPQPAAVRALKANLARLKATAAQVAAVDAQGFLAGTPQPFDLVWLDPPFAAELWTPLATRLEQGWLAPAAWIYVESPRGTAPALPPNWLPHREASAGEVRHALYRRSVAVPLS